MMWPSPWRAMGMAMPISSATRLPERRSKRLRYASSILYLRRVAPTSPTKGVGYVSASLCSSGTEVGRRTLRSTLGYPGNLLEIEQANHDSTRVVAQDPRRVGRLLSRAQ